MFVLVFAVLCASSRPDPIGGDATLMCAGANSLLTHGDLDLGRLRLDVTRAPNGKQYSKYPLLAVVQCVPSMKLQAIGMAAWPRDAGLHGWLEGLFPHLITSVFAVGVMGLALQLGASTATAAVFALLVVFTTPMWSAGRSLYSENLQATLLLWTLLIWMRARDTSARGAFVLGGVLSGLAINIKVVWFVLPLAVLVDQLHERWDALRIRRLALAAAAALPGLAAWLFYNHLRYGSMLEAGYGTERDDAMGFNVPLASGLYGLLFSSGKSVFLYAPLLIISVCTLASFAREHRRELVFFGIPTAFTFIVAAKWWAWHGDWAWGPRLVLPVLPLMCFPVLPLLARTGLVRFIVGGVAVVGVCIQLSAVLVAPGRHLEVTRDGMYATVNVGIKKPARDPQLLLHFVPEMSPIVAQPWLLARYVWREPWTDASWYPWKTLNLPKLRPERDPTPKRLDLWFDTQRPAHLALEGLCVWIAVASAVWLRRELRRAGQDSP